MRDGRQAAFPAKDDESLRRERRIAAGQVGDADDSNPPARSRGVFDERLRFGGGMIAAQNQFRRV